MQRQLSLTSSARTAMSSHSSLQSHNTIAITISVVAGPNLHIYPLHASHQLSAVPFTSTVPPPDNTHRHSSSPITTHHHSSPTHTHHPLIITHHPLIIIHHPPITTHYFSSSHIAHSGGAGGGGGGGGGGVFLTGMGDGDGEGDGDDEMDIYEARYVRS